MPKWHLLLLFGVFLCEIIRKLFGAGVRHQLMQFKISTITHSIYGSVASAKTASSQTKTERSTTRMASESEKGNANVIIIWWNLWASKTQWEWTIFLRKHFQVEWTWPDPFPHNMANGTNFLGWCFSTRPIFIVMNKCKYYTRFVGFQFVRRRQRPNLRISRRTSRQRVHGNCCPFHGRTRFGINACAPHPNYGIFSVLYSLIFVFLFPFPARSHDKLSSFFRCLKRFEWRCPWRASILDKQSLALTFWPWLFLFFFLFLSGRRSDTCENWYMP